MTNPWAELRPEPPYILPMDETQILEYDSRRHEGSKLGLDSIPEPFIGNPETAKVVLLLLNPGYSRKGSEAHRNPALKEELFRNLRGERGPYPFYPLNPALSWSPTAQWWVPRTRELRQATGLNDLMLSERLLAIEWFPYPSRSSGLPTRQLCNSQDYTFELAKRMLDTKFVVRTRSVNHWSKVDPRFRNIPSLNNPQCGFISPGNTGGNTGGNVESGLFKEIVDVLTAE